MLRAILHGDSVQVADLLANRPTLVRAHSKGGENIWHYSARSGHVEVLKVVAKSVQQALRLQNKGDRLLGQVCRTFATSRETSCGRSF